MAKIRKKDQREWTPESVPSTQAPADSARGAGPRSADDISNRAPESQDDPTASAPQSVGDTTTGASDRERIAMRAYELYQQRGGAEGRAMDDWLAAEREFNPARAADDDRNPE
jgi:hypothetical protein